jgi:hypothetical protein
MNRSFAVLALALCIPFTAHADDASKRAKAEELIGILHSEKMVTQLSANLKKQVADAAQQVTGSSPTPENKARLDEFEKKVSGLFDEQLGWNVMGPQIVDVYATTFTEDELTAIVNFYKSPAGSAFLTKTPEVNNQLNQLAQPKLAALQTQVRLAFEDFRKSQQTAPAPPTLNSLPPAGPSAPSITAPKSTIPTAPGTK